MCVNPCVYEVLHINKDQMHDECIFPGRRSPRLFQACKDLQTRRSHTHASGNRMGLDGIITSVDDDHTNSQR